MTNQDYTHVTLVVDRSGSMDSVKDDAQGGINSLLTEQHALPGKLSVTLVQFDDQFDTVKRMAARKFDYKLEPRGMTALLDAVGQEIRRTGEDLAKLDEHKRPGNVLFVVVTDGHENSSHDYNFEQVRSMVSHQRDVYGWTFQFIGAGDAAWQGQEMGMPTTAHDHTGSANRAVYSSISSSMASYRQGAKFSMPDYVADPGDRPTTKKSIKKTASKKVTVKKTAPKSTAPTRTASTTKATASPKTTSSTVKKTTAPTAKKTAVKSTSAKKAATGAPARKAPVRKTAG